MPHALHSACLIAGSLFAASGGYGQQMDGWPDWLNEAMAVESGKLETAEFEIEAGPYQFTLPKDSSGPNTFDGGWYFESQIGSDAKQECYVFTGDNDLATLVNNLAELSIQTTADANGGNTDNRSILALGAGHIEGVPYLNIEWFYTVGEAPNLLIGYTKVSAASNGAFAQACTHTALGHRETFRNTFTEFVQSAQQPDPPAAPYYEELSLEKLDGQPIGYTLYSYTLDAEGDTYIESSTASIYPIGPDTIMSNDGASATWSTPDGRLINTSYASAENGELMTSLQLERNQDDDWIVSGTFQGKELQKIIDGTEDPISELGEMQLARALFASEDRTVSYPVWVPDADPTQIVTAKIERQDSEVKGKALLTLGPITIDSRLDAAGSLLHAEMSVGASIFTVERVWNRGKPH